METHHGGIGGNGNPAMFLEETHKRRWWEDSNGAIGKRKVRRGQVDLGRPVEPGIKNHQPGTGTSFV